MLNKKQKKTNGGLFCAIGECTDRSIKFWDSLGWKRVFVKLNQEIGYKELPYVQPALDFDLRTGEIMSGASQVAQHLMIDSFGNKITKEDLKLIYEKVLTSSSFPKEAFSNEEAYQKHLSYINGFRDKFIEYIDSNGEILFLDKQEASSRGLDALSEI